MARFLRNVSTALTKRPPDGAPARPPAQPKVAEPSRAPESPRRYCARWFAGPRPGVHVLRFDTGHTPLDWRPEARARLTLRDGRSVDVELIADASTRPGVIAPDLFVYLFLVLDGIDPAEVLAVEIESAGTLLRLEP